MDAFKIKTNTWHWKLYKFGYFGKKPKSFCEYFWKICLFLFDAISLAFIIFFLFIDFVFIAVGIIFGIVALTLSHYAIWAKRKIFDKEDKSESGFFATKYHSFKNKYCPGVEIINE